MNWDAIGAIAEFVGAIAVLLTLVYLAIQIRQNSKLMEESRNVEIARNFQSRTEQRMLLHELAIKSDDVLHARRDIRQVEWPEMLDRYNALSEDERERYYHFVRTQIIHTENLFFQKGLGLVDEELYSNTRTMITREGHLWREIGALKGFRPSFIAEMDRILDGDE